MKPLRDILKDIWICKGEKTDLHYKCVVLCVKTTEVDVEL